MSAKFPLKLHQVLVRRQGKTVIGPLDLELVADGVTIIVGPNGSGKTTLLRVMHGIERINGGTVSWAQDDPSKHAFVFQSPVVLRRSVAENLAYPLRLLKVPHAEVNTAVADWLARIGLSGKAQTAATRLSGGERQKLAIARALIRKPDVLFLDEPCANLDGHATREIEAVLQETAAAGTRLVMATHDMGQARRLAQDLVFTLNGHIHESGKAEAIFVHPKTKELAAFLKGDIVV
ncbi:MAG: ATP-binding cassette domain-containing protein [Yoonia sp.]|nr:ATP-binding cassette domain-containing protein [Yoonia sp.]